MDCASKEGASEADILELISFEVPTTRSGQCLNACVMETVGLVWLLETLWMSAFNTDLHFIGKRWRCIA